MKYFKNTELAKLYHVSEKSVRNWIQAAKDGKLDLQLYEKKDRAFVANTSKNIVLIEELVKKGKKYVNTRGVRTLLPKETFYKTFDQKQILDIISNLTIQKEIPLQYGYADGGANSWDHYANRLFNEKTPNILNRTVELVDMTAPNVDKLLANHSKINVIDLGPGNGLPVRSTLARLLEKGQLGRYIAIDLSQEMLNIVEKNMNTWFGDKVTFEGHVLDINYERFNHLLAGEHSDETTSTTANLVFLLGATLNNFRRPDQVLHTINNSLGINDLLLYSGYLDTPRTRRYFDLSGTDEKDTQQSGLIPHLWQIDETISDFEYLFSEEKRCRFRTMRPKIDLSVKLELDGKTQHIELRKNESIILWRHRHYSITDLVKLFDENEFDLLQTTKSKEQDYILLLSKIKTNGDL